MPNITIDGRGVTVPAGATILQAARALGLEIPTLCHRDGCRPETSCLVCVVRVNGSGKLLPSCATLAAEGMTVESEAPEVHEARRTALELLLGDHLGDCVAPCELTCPAGMDIPEVLLLVQQGRLDDAARAVLRRIPLPAVLGRICPANCQRGCRRGQLDQAVTIAVVESHLGDYLLRHPELAPVIPPATGRRVAVIGSGLAGLTAAWFLRREGHEVVLLEAGERLGGELLAVPEAQDVLEAEIARVLSIGIETRRATGGAELQPALHADFDAVVLADGQEPPTDLPENLFVAETSSHPARSVAAGRAAALQVAAYLRGETAETNTRHFSVHMGRLEPEELHLMANNTGTAAPLVLAAEAARCLQCGCARDDTCGLRHWSAVYGAEARRFAAQRRPYERDASHSLVVYESGKCIACGLCVQIAEQRREELGLAFIDRGFDVRPGVPWGESLAQGLEHAARECAAACPTAAITLRQR